MVSSTSQIALAQTPSNPPAVESEARPDEAAEAQFDVGYRLAKDGDYEGAALAFETAYRLKRNPSVLFNLGQARAASGDPVGAYDAFQEYLRLGGMDAERERTVRRFLSVVEARIGELSLNVAPAGAIVEIDGELAGVAPLTNAIRLATGTHALVVRAEGRPTEALRLNVVSRATSTLTVRLMPPPASGFLEVNCGVPDIELRLDGEPRGRTPLNAPLALAPGLHELVLRRAGYVSQTARLEINPGAVQAVLCDGQWHSEIPREHAATLVVATTAAGGKDLGARVYVDGRALATTAAVLPSGRHHVEVRASQHEPWRQDIDLAAGAVLHLSPDLLPTETHKEERRALRDRQELWMQISLGTSGVFIATAVAMSLANARSYDRWQKERDLLNRETVASDDLVVRLRANYERALTMQRINHAVWGTAVIGGASLGVAALLWLTLEPNPDATNLRAQAGTHGGALSYEVRF